MAKQTGKHRTGAAKDRKSILARLSGLTISSFLIYLLCLTIPVSLLSIALIFQSMNMEMRRETERLRCEQLASIFSERVDCICESALGLFKMNWFQHYISPYGIYDDEFNIVTRQEICRQLEAMTKDAQLVDNVIVVCPIKNTIINYGGGFDIENADSVCQVSVTVQNQRVVNIEPENPEQNIVLTLQNTRKTNDYSVIGIILSKQKIGTYIANSTNELPEYIAISCGGQALYSRGETTGLELYTMTRGIVAPIQVMVGYDLHYLNRLNRILQTYLGIVKMIAAVLILMATILTILKLRPINNLFNRSLKTHELAHNLHGNDIYRQIGDIVDHVRQENQTLHETNTNITQSLHRMKQFLQSTFIYSMLSPDFDFDDPILEENLPWIREGLPFLLLVLGEKTDSRPSDQASLISDRIRKELSSGAIHSAHWHLVRNEQLILLWYSDIDEARRQVTILNDMIPAAADEGLIIAASPLMTDIRDIGESYLLTKNRMEEDHKEKAPLPLTVQINFVTALQNSHEAECLRILDEARDMYCAEQLYDLLSQIAQEYGMCDALPEPDNSWETVTALTTDLCRCFDAQRHSDSMTSAETICRYIDEHYQEPAISIKQLSDIFGVNGTLISKIFKARYDVTFSDYLLKLRMDKAKELLLHTDESLAVIAEKTGYLNYYSFKRAFQRGQGISPREYREGENNGDIDRNPLT